MAKPADRPFVATFYSYKGGVGRTTLAANTAAALAQHGKTLLWDLDIEAPGLHLIRDLRPARPVKAGSFDRLLDWQRADCAPPKAKALKAWDACVLPVETSAQLHLLPAYADEQQLLQAYARLDWARFFGREPDKGLALIDTLLAHWAGQGYEFVVIDSRTGITDLGALLAAAVPDISFLVGNFGRQNTLGLRLVWQALQAAVDGQLPGRNQRGLDPLQRRLVVSPMPQLDAERLAAAYETWVEAFGLRPTEWLEIAEWPELRFSESILLLSNPQAGPSAQYRQVAQAVLDARRVQRDAVLADAAQSTLYPELARSDARARGKAAQAQGLRFEDMVAHVLQLLRYTVQRETSVDANKVDLIASLHSTLKDEAWMVECKDSQATKEMVEKLALWAGQPEARNRQMSPMLVAQGFAPAALKAARDCGVSCFTLAQLEERLFNFKPYLAQLRATFEQSPLAQAYVAQHVVAARPPASEDGATAESGAQPELLAHGMAWSTGQGKPLWLLLGDYGTGKTAFTQRLAYELARRCETDAAAPAPVLINLRDYPNFTTLEAVVEEHLAKTLNVRGSASALLHLLHRGRCVLLLDSFDEMGLAAVGVSIEEQFRQLVRPMVQPGQAGRMLITCREEFFRERKDAESAAAGVTDRLVRPGSALEQAARAFDAHIDTLAYFDQDQVREYLGKRLGEQEGEKAFSQIRAVHGLADLATRPQLLEIVLDSLPELMQRGGQVNAGLLYFTYINRWLQRHRSGSSQLSQDALLQLLELLAQTLWARGAAPLHYTQLLAEVQRHQSLFPERDPVRVDLELRSSAFLVRSPDGLYRFSHRSFLEFFFARRLWRLAEAQDTEALAEALGAVPLRVEVVRFFADLWRGQGRPPCTLSARMLIARQYPPMVAANLLRWGYWQGLTDADEDEPAVWAQTLPAEGALLAKVDLSGEFLGRAPLRGAVLDEAQLVGAILDQADLRGASLRAARADEADFQAIEGDDLAATGLSGIGSLWRRARLRGASFEHADLRGSDWRGAEIGRTRFEGARLMLAILSHSHAYGMKHADLAHASFWHGRERAPKPVPTSTPHWRQLPMGGVNALAFAPDGRCLASGGDDGTLRLWDVTTGRELRRLQGHEGAVQSVAWSAQGDLASGGSDGMVRLWDAATGRELRRLQGRMGRLLSLAWSAQGDLASGGDDGMVRLWDAATGRELRRLQGHEGGVWSLAWSAQGDLASGGVDGAVRLWDAATGRELRQLLGHGDWVRSLAWSVKGELASGGDDGTVRLWDAATGRELRRLQGHEDWVLSLAWSAQGHLASGGDDGTVRLWDAATGRELRRLEEQSSWVQSLTWSAQGELAIGGLDGTVRLWDAVTGRGLRWLDGNDSWVRSLAWSAQGDLASGGSDGTVRLWDAATGRELRRLQGRMGRLLSLSWSAQGDLASGGDDGTVRLWDAGTGRELRRLQGHKGGVLSLAWSPQGALASGGRDGTVRLWDAATGRELRRLQGHQGEVGSLAWSAQGELASGGDDGTVRLWDAATGRELRRLQGHKGRLLSLAWSAQGDLASGGVDETVRLWEMVTGRELRQLHGHTDWVRSLAWSVQGDLASGGDDGTVRLWDAATGRELRRLQGHGNRVQSLAWSPSSELAVAGALLTVYPPSALRAQRSSAPSWSFQARIADQPLGMIPHLVDNPAVILYPDGTHAGSGEALEWLEYHEPSTDPGDPYPTIHRASDAPWLRRKP